VNLNSISEQLLCAGALLGSNESLLVEGLDNSIVQSSVEESSIASEFSALTESSQSLVLDDCPILGEQNYFSVPTACFLLLRFLLHALLCYFPIFFYPFPFVVSKKTELY
jgi:hypothetical protein